MKEILWEKWEFGIKRYLAVGLLLASQSWSAISEELTEFTATYSGFRGNLKVGSAKQSLTKRQDGLYQLNYESHASFLILHDNRQEESLFKVQNHALIPVSYDYARTGTGKDKFLHVEFDHEAHQLTINHGESQNWTTELDNQLYRYDFQRKLNANRPQLSYDIINARGEPKTYHLTLLGEETLVLPYGEVSTMKAKIVRESNKRETYIWFAPEFQHLMVRIQQFKKGKEQIDVQLATLEMAN